MTLPLSKEMLGRVFSGSGAPIDGLGPVYGEKQADINGRPINPVSRTYPRNYIHTGISSIDALSTLIRGQKLPIFSGSGMNHNKLAVQPVRQSKVAGVAGEFAAVSYTHLWCAGVIWRTCCAGICFSGSPACPDTIFPRRIRAFTGFAWSISRWSSGWTSCGISTLACPTSLSSPCPAFSSTTCATPSWS